MSTDKIAHLVSRLDALTGELAEVRDEIADLQASRDQQGSDLASLKSDVATVKVEVSGLRGLMDAQSLILTNITGKIGSATRWGAGLPTGVLVLLEIARQLGWLPALGH